MKIIKITTMLMAVISFQTMAISFEKENFEKKSYYPCPTEHLDYEIRTDRYSFLEYKKTILEIINMDTLKERQSTDYKLRFFGELKSYKNEKTEYFFIKTFDMDTKEIKWTNTDIITGDPFMDADDVLIRMENKICGKKENTVDLSKEVQPL